ncbi:cobalamin biosynthesis protein [Sphingomonas sp. 4RDLI-65]|uniref:cobalamin biosynthesis protein n=1 Tax=Sphingomonas sp. 4RDLI-65 TaxID=3111641 RepID=UPI003C2BECDD
MIVAGFGWRTGANLGAIRSALASAQQGQPPVTALAAPHDKLALVSPLAEALGVAMIAVSPSALQSSPTPTQSPASLKARATGSVAEAAALAAAGPGAWLLTTRHISPDRTATCALARSCTEGPAQ